MDSLAPEPTDHILEIGCGTGVAAARILQRLTRGRLTAIDRSASAIRTAEKLNRSAIDAGRVRFHPVALEKADFGGERFDKVLAVNVNRFWLKPIDESALWRAILKPNAVVCLVYQPPPGQSTERIIEACSESFRRSGFAEVRVLSSETAVCIRASGTPS